MSHMAPHTSNDDLNEEHISGGGGGGGGDRHTHYNLIMYAYHTSERKLAECLATVVWHIYMTLYFAPNMVYVVNMIGKATVKGDRQTLKASKIVA